MATPRTTGEGAKPRRNSLQEAMLLLRRLMEGERLSVTSLLASKNVPSDSTGRRYLTLLEKFVPGVVRLPGSRPAEWVYRASIGEPVDRLTVLSVRLARCLLVFLRGSQLDRSLETLIGTTSANLPPDLAPGDLSRMFFSTAYKAPGVAADTVDRVVEAIVETKQVEATYESFEGIARNIVVEPYTLIFSTSGLHCYGRCAGSPKTAHIDTRRIYSLARFRSFRPTSRRFAYPERDEYDPAEIFKNCWGIILPPDPEAEPVDAVLRFDGRWGHFLKTTPWHPSQSEPRRLPSGKFEITLRVHQTLDFVQWIRGHGKEITVVKPTALRKAVAEQSPRGKGNESGGE